MYQDDNYELEGLVERAMMKFDNFSMQRRPFNICCRCHICNDSKKDRTKSRLNAYYYQGDLWVNCYNCGFSGKASYYLMLHHPYEWGIYRDRIRSQRLAQFQRDKPDKNEDIKARSFEEMFTEIQEETVEYPRELPLCYSLNDIVETHPIVQYVKGRMIPKEKWNRLFFTTEFKKLSNMVVPNTYSNEEPEPRLVLPIYNKDGFIESFQGRSLRDDGSVRYITIKYSEDATKIYGLDTVDTSRTAYFLEGQIDSLFIDNGMAITGGSVSLQELNRYYNYDRAFIMDNEPRHPDTIKRINKLLQDGEKIVLFDRVEWEGKDINAFVQNGISIKDINEYIRNNTLSGIEARLRFTAWTQVDQYRIRQERKNKYIQEERSKNLQSIFDKVNKKGFH